MNNDCPDQMTMIGLHKLAEQIGDGMVPELYELLREQAASRPCHANVTPFPADRARLPRRSASAIPMLAHVTGVNKILPFPGEAVQRLETYKKQG